MKLLEAFKTRFEPPVEEALRDTFGGELKYECSKIFFIVLVMSDIRFCK
jgi:hypothetical protein